MTFQMIDTGVEYLEVANTASGSDRVLTVLGANLGGSNFNSKRLSGAGIDGGASNGDDGAAVVVQPVPADHKVVILSFECLAYDNVQNGRNCYVAAQHGHGGQFQLRRGNTTDNSDATGVVPPKVVPWDNVTRHMGGFYGFDSAWAIPGAVPTGYIKQATTFSSRIYLEMKANEFLTVSLRHVTGADIDAATYKLACCVRLRGWLLPAGYTLNLQTFPGAMVL